MWNPSQARDAIGRWGSGAAGMVTESRVKTAVALGIKSALYHLGNMDDPAMEVIEPHVESMIHHIGEHMQVASGHARNAARAAIVAMMLTAGGP